MSTDTSPTAELFSCDPAYLNPGDKPVAFGSDKDRDPPQNTADVTQCLPSNSLKAHPVLTTLAALPSIRSGGQQISPVSQIIIHRKQRCPWLATKVKTWFRRDFSHRLQPLPRLQHCYACITSRATGRSMCERRVASKGPHSIWIRRGRRYNRGGRWKRGIVSPGDSSHQMGRLRLRAPTRDGTRCSP